MAIDTAALFGRPVADTKAKVKVSLIAINPKTRGVQLWKDGPFWAETNSGESEVQDHPEYGALYTFDNADAAVKSRFSESGSKTKGCRFRAGAIFFSRKNDIMQMFSPWGCCTLEQFAHGERRSEDG